MDVASYSYSQPSQDIKPKRELRRFAPQLSFGFWLCLNIDVYSYNYKNLRRQLDAQKEDQT
ncbi:hypothetical protein B9G53_09120 [Pseudanabaena sp. SR411]|nr:hypothetical protein B9G53_09120 [Pseudanabaena sp. SR411]